ncbi:MAG TPA: winged helix-turn-helix domain-containing protein [Candidatus Baltobacteraceae bacterium]|nr:winged helix-turn-helix domain-containing protein [Candidatus Baltobacteraceae bacterium]
MSVISIPLGNIPPVPPESFERLLRRAAASCWLARFRSQASSKGVSTVNHYEIGETAGAIWQLLSSDGPQTFAALMEEVDAPQSIFFMAVGWLSRENKLQFDAANGDYLVSLRQ